MPCQGCGSSAPPPPSVLRVNEKPDTGQVAFKVVMMGDKGVGKSCLVQRFTKGTFIDGIEAPTIGAAFTSQTVSVSGREVKLHLWDTAGEEMYRSMTKSFFRGAAGAILVYDITNRTTFGSLQAWIKDFKDQAGLPHAPIILVGNKSDCVTSRAVSTQEGQDFAAAHELTFFESSARTHSNVREVYVALAQRLSQ